MSVLRAATARFASEAGDAVGPLDFALSAGEHKVLVCANVREASIAARLCAGIVKPTRGSIYIGDYDTRLQPPQAKRLVGFVDVAGAAGDRHAFACEVAFRADVWGIDVATAQVRARETLAAVGDARDPYSRALALALVPDIRLLIVDQPAHPRYRSAIVRIRPAVAMLETRVAAKRPAIAAPRDRATVLS